jgi:hypothetical protein
VERLGQAAPPEALKSEHRESKQTFLFLFLFRRILESGYRPGVVLFMI